MISGSGVQTHKYAEGMTIYAPNFEEVEGAYWFGSVRPVQSSL